MWRKRWQEVRNPPATGPSKDAVLNGLGRCSARDYAQSARLRRVACWYWGYPFALVLMLLSVAAPFIYFRRKGWLK